MPVRSLFYIYYIVQSTSTSWLNDTLKQKKQPAVQQTEAAAALWLTTNMGVKANPAH